MLSLWTALLDVPGMRSILRSVNRAREPFYEELGRRIAQRRAERNLSQKDLGEMMQPRMTRASLANIENGKQRVLAHTLVQLAAALECDVNALVSVSAAPDAEGNAAVHRELEQKMREEKVPKAAVDAL